MPDLWSPQELATRFAAYIEELHEFFDCHQLAYGSPEDVLVLVDTLDGPGPFRDELNSMLRSIILREGGTVPQTELLEILLVAGGGTSVDPTSAELQPSIRKLLGVAAGTARRPWNEPPDQPSPELGSAASAEVSNIVPFPERSPWPKNDSRRPPPPPPDEVEVDPSVTFAAVVAARIAANSPGALPAEEPEAEAEPAEVARAQPAEVPEKAPSIPPANAEPPKPSMDGDLLAWLPKLSPSLHRLVMMSGGAVAAALVVAILVMQARGPAPVAGASASVTAAQPPAPQAALNQRVATVAPASRPTAVVSDPQTATAMPMHPRSEDDLVAAPWSGSKLPPTNAAQPQAAAPVNPPQATSRPSLTATQSAPADSSRDTLRPVDESLYRHSGSGPAADPPTRGGSALSDHPRYLDVSSGVMADNLISAPMPSYPMIAHLTHVHGEVILQAVIGKDGRVSTAHVLSGHRLLRSAAVDAVKRWRYRPYHVDGHPVDVSTIVTVKFHGAH